MEITKETIYTLTFTQEELDSFIQDLAQLESNRIISTNSQKILNRIVQYYNK